MRLGAHRERLPACVGAADRVLWFQPPEMDWDMEAVAAASRVPSTVHTSVEGIIRTLVGECVSGDRIVVMSNGGFQGIHRRLLDALRNGVSCS
jgi:UDP-N-acetylmuramate: L-alanyl-gamma-D-glutamyl-meso-diaminopimelate ligase